MNEWETIAFRAKKRYKEYLSSIAKKDGRTLAGMIKHLVEKNFPDPKKVKNG